jgi:hypothetical protein
LRQHLHAKEAVGRGQVKRPLVWATERQITRATEPAEIFSIVLYEEAMAEVASFVEGALRAAQAQGRI